MATPLFLFTEASAATLFSIPAAAAVLSNVPSISFPYTVKFAALMLNGGISGDVFVLLSGPPQCISGQAVELLVIFIAGWALLALTPCAYATATAALTHQAAVTPSIASVTVDTLALVCTLPTALVALSRYGADAFAIVFPVPASFAVALVNVSADLRKKIKAV